MIMHRWRDTSIHGRMTLSISITIIQKRNSILQLKNLHMYNLGCSVTKMLDHNNHNAILYHNNSLFLIYSAYSIKKRNLKGYAKI